MRGLGLKVMVEPVTFAEWVDLDLFGMRVITWGGELLSGLGLLLAMVGLAGAVSYSVGQRKKELGIRAALGARRGQLLAMLLRQSAAVVGAGVAIGLALGTVASALLKSQFYRMGAVEWTVLLPVTAAVMGLALVMTCLSAMPWLRVDPMDGREARVIHASGSFVEHAPGETPSRVAASARRAFRPYRRQTRS